MNNKNLLFLLLLLCKPAYSSELAQSNKPTKETDQHITKIEEKSFVEKWMPTALTTVWASSTTVGSLCYLSPAIRHAIYGLNIDYTSPSTLKDSLIKFVKRNLLMDQLLAITIITPPTIWATSYGLNYLTEKIDLTQENEWVKKSAELIKKFKKSFAAKAFVSASIVALYSMYPHNSLSIRAEKEVSKLLVN